MTLSIDFLCNLVTVFWTVNGNRRIAKDDIYIYIIYLFIYND
jgi:hypothetical protein